MTGSFGDGGEVCIADGHHSALINYQTLGDNLSTVGQAGKVNDFIEFILNLSLYNIM